MKFIDNISVKSKITLLIFISITSLIVLGVMNVVSSQRLNESTISIYKKSYIPSVKIAKINELMVENVEMLLLAGYHDPLLEVSKEHEKTHQVDAHLDKIPKNINTINQLWQEYLENQLSYEEKKLANEWADTRKIFVEDGLKKAIEIFETGDYIKAQLFTVTDVLPLYNSSKPKTETLLDFQQKTASSLMVDANHTFENIKMLLIVIATISLVLLIFLSLIVVKNITSSLNVLQIGLDSFFSFLNRQSEKTDLIKLDSKDEFGVMAKVVNENISLIEKEATSDVKLVQEAKYVIGRVRNGWYSEHIKATTTNESLEEFKNEVNDMIRITKQHFVDMNSVLEEYVAYNYTKELTLDISEKGGVFEILVTDINKLRNAITAMLKTSLTNGLDMQNDASSLKQIVESLSTASNQQAASLEETAAAMEEMTSNVQSNAQKTEDMAKMAQETDTAAKDGANLANRTSSAMTEIQSATSSINNAVNIIENIAFQTNILSLNAAVEAATAGDAGKGFAVVAQEVRNLANRSAEAAKQIKEMALQASQKSDEGMSISQELTAGFEVIAKKIEQTTMLVQDVSSASREQMQGIGQINTAVTQLDQMTQENAKVAAKADSIAEATINKARAMVEDASSKEFVGKSDIRASQTNSKEVVKKPQTKETMKQPEPKRVSSKPSSDVWESF